MNKIIGAIAVLALVVAGFALVGDNQPVPILGGTTNFDTLQLEDGVLTASTTLRFPVASVFGGTITGTSGASTFATTTTEALTQGGCRMATSTSPEANNLTFTASEVQTCRYWDITQNRISQTLTLPASSTITTLIPNAGDVATVWVRNATSTSANFRIAAGTGWAMQTIAASSTSGGTYTASTTNAEWSRMTFIRKADTDIDILWEYFK